MKVKDSVRVGSIYNDGEYKAKNPDWHVADSPWKANQISKIINKNKIVASEICEVGCGAGEILRQLSLRSDFLNVRFSGYEVSSDAFELCKERSSENVRFFLKDIIEEQVFYDILLCIDVFEHVDNYMGFLLALKQKATYKVFHIPLDLSVSVLMRGTLLNARNSFGHLHYFTPDTALATLKDCGYEVVDCIYTPSFVADLPAKTFKGKLAKLLRHLLYSISPKLMSTLVGGCKLMVLTK